MSDSLKLKLDVVCHWTTIFHSFLQLFHGAQFWALVEPFRQDSSQKPFQSSLSCNGLCCCPAKDWTFSLVWGHVHSGAGFLHELLYILLNFVQTSITASLKNHKHDADATMLHHRNGLSQLISSTWFYSPLAQRDHFFVSSDHRMIFPQPFCACSLMSSYFLATLS